MNRVRGFFVKINYCIDDVKNELNCLKGLENKVVKIKGYIPCAGTYTKDQATMIFRASSFCEAESIIESIPFKNNKSFSFEILSGNYINLQIV